MKKRIKYIIPIILMLFVFAFNISSVSAAGTYFSDDFEAETNGASPPYTNFTEESKTGTGSCSIRALPGASQVVSLDASLNDTYNIIATFNELDPTDAKLTLFNDLYINSMGGATYITFGNQSIQAAYVINADGSIESASGTAISASGTIIGRVEYNLQTVININSKTYDIYVNNILVGDNIACEPSSVTTSGFVMFGIDCTLTSPPGVTTETFFDNIRVVGTPPNPPNPQTGDYSTNYLLFSLLIIPIVCMGYFIRKKRLL